MCLNEGHNSLHYTLKSTLPAINNLNYYESVPFKCYTRHAFFQFAVGRASNNASRSDGQP